MKIKNQFNFVIENIFLEFNRKIELNMTICINIVDTSFATVKASITFLNHFIYRRKLI